MKNILAKIIVWVFLIGVLAFFAYYLVIIPFNHFCPQFGIELTIIGILILWIVFAVIITGAFYLAKLVIWAIENY